jgi:ATP adenylyltransferase
MGLDLEHNTLWRKVVDCTELALASGDLHAIETHGHTLTQDGFEFVVRVARNLKRKEKQKQAQPDFNPFLPPEPALTVSDISPSHVSVLNKFNVLNHHLLIVTRAYESQERLLTHQDFEALWRCLPEYPSLGFYNGGDAAGASQHHKHLQLVPLPLYEGTSSYPFAPYYKSKSQPGVINRIPCLPFRHAWCNLPKGLINDPAKAAAYCWTHYREMLQSVKIDAIAVEDGDMHSAPYNLLLTSHWMLLIPRSRECWEGISVNALGFVGSLFVLDETDLKKLRSYGPLNLLKAVTGN